MANISYEYKTTNVLFIFQTRRVEITADIIEDNRAQPNDLSSVENDSELSIKFQIGDEVYYYKSLLAGNLRVGKIIEFKNGEAKIQDLKMKSKEFWVKTDKLKHVDK